MNNTCHFGPDITGKFLVEVVSSERADACDPTFCLCDTHDFDDIRYQVANKDFTQPNTFELELAARQAAAYDRTRKPHEVDWDQTTGIPDKPTCFVEPCIEIDVPKIPGTEGYIDGALSGSEQPGFIETEPR